MNIRSYAVIALVLSSTVLSPTMDPQTFDYAPTYIPIYPDGTGHYVPASTSSAIGPVYDNGPTMIPLCLNSGTGKYYACPAPGSGSGGAPTTNPTGGANNYAPIASPTFTGQVTAPGYTETLTTPTSSSSTCTAGQFTDDANFHYVCTATNTWKRVALVAF